MRVTRVCNQILLPRVSPARGLDTSSNCASSEASQKIQEVFAPAFGKTLAVEVVRTRRLELPLAEPRIAHGSWPSLIATWTAVAMLAACQAPETSEPGWATRSTFGGHPT